MLPPPLREPPPEKLPPPPEKLLDELRVPPLNDDELYELAEEVLRDDELLRDESYAEERWLLFERPLLCDVVADAREVLGVVPRPTEPLRCCSRADA